VIVLGVTIDTRLHLFFMHLPKGFAPGHRNTGSRMNVAKAVEERAY